MFSKDYFPLRCNEVVKGNKGPKNEHKDNDHVSYLETSLFHKALQRVGFKYLLNKIK